MNQTQTTPIPSTTKPSRTALIGCGVAAVGAFLPWVSVVTIFGTFNMAGTSGDGRFALVIAGVLAALIASRKAPRFMLAVAVLSVIFAVGEYVHISTSLSNAGDTEGATMSIGIGVPVMLVGFIVALVGVVKARRSAAALTAAVFVPPTLTTTP